MDFVNHIFLFSLTILTLPIPYSNPQRVFTCSRQKCKDGRCDKMEKYKGTKPPAWCLQNGGKPFKVESSSSWSQKCQNNKCAESNKFSQKFDDMSGKGVNQIDLYCNKDSCTVKVCDRGGCKGKVIRKAEVERDIAKMPRCNQVGRRKRSFIAKLQGFCCNIVQKGGLEIIQLVRTGGGGIG